MHQEKRLKEVIEGVLEKDPRARNDDNWLILQVLRKMGFDVYINYSEMPKMPKFESIIRTRARIQNEDKKFLPTDPNVEQHRSAQVPDEEGVTFEKPAEVEG